METERQLPPGMKDCDNPLCEGCVLPGALMHLVPDIWHPNWRTENGRDFAQFGPDAE